MGILSDIFDFFFGWLISDAPQQQQRTGTELTKASTSAHVPVLYGKNGRVKGTIIFQATNDADNDDIENDLLHLIIVWGMGGVESIDQIYLDDVAITDNKFYAGGTNRWAHSVDFVNGMQSYSDPLLNAAGWNPESDKMTGLCCSYVRLEWTTTKSVFNGIPDIRADITGQRINNLGTGTLIPSSNPVDQLYHYLIGCPVGKKLSASKVDYQSFIDARAICEKQVETVTGTGEFQPLFTSNTVLDTSQSILDNVNQLLKACRGWLPVVDGKLTLIIEDDNPATSETLDDENIVEIKEITNSSTSQRFNRVTVKYIDPDANWTEQEAVYPEPQSELETQWLEEDNGVLLETSLTLKTCTDYYEALRFAKTFAMISREQLRAAIECDPIAQQFQVGDIVPVTHDVPGWVAKPFRVENVQRDTEGNVTLTIREHQPYIYDWNNTGTKPEFPDTTNTLTDPEQPTNIVVNALYSDAGQFLIQWDSAVQQHRWFLQDSGGDIIRHGNESKKYVYLNDLPMGDFTFGVKAKRSFGRSSNFTKLTFTVSVPPTPENPIVTIEEGQARIVPTLGAQSWNFYWWVNTVDDFDSAEYQGSGQAITIATNTTQKYFVWYRLVLPAGQSNIVALSFDGLAPVIELPPEIEETLDTLEQTQADIQESISSNIDAVLELLGQEAESAVTTVQADAKIQRNEVEILNEQEARAAEVTTLNASLNGKASIASVNQVSSDLSGTNSALNAVTAKVDNPTTGLSATYTKANQAQVTADGAANSVSTLTNQVNDSTSGLSATNDRLDGVIIDAGNNATAISALEQQVNNSTSGLSATNNRLDQVVIDAGNNASAISSHQLNIESLDSGLTVTNDTLNSVKSTADGAALSVSAVEQTVNDPVNGVTATANRISTVESNQTDQANAIAVIEENLGIQDGDNSVIISRLNVVEALANDNYNAIATTEATANTADSNASSALTLATAINDDIANFAEFALKTNVNGYVSGIHNQNDGSFSQLVIQTDAFIVKDGSGANVLYKDGTTWHFDGFINAQGGTFTGSLSSNDGDIGGWFISPGLLKSADNGERIELNSSLNRISIFGTSSENVVMGYLANLPKNNGVGNWSPSDYGFWARAGDQLVIDGNIDHVSGDFIVEDSADVIIKSGANDAIRLGTHNADRGLFVFDGQGTSDSNIRAELSDRRLYLGDENSYLKYENDSVQLSGTISATTIVDTDYTTTGNGWRLNIDPQMNTILWYGDESIPIQDQWSGNGNFILGKSGTVYIREGYGEFNDLTAKRFVANESNGFIYIGVDDHDSDSLIEAKMGYSAGTDYGYGDGDNVDHSEIEFSRAGVHIRAKTSLEGYPYVINLYGDTYFHNNVRVAGTLTSLTAGHEILLPVNFHAEIGECIVIENLVEKSMNTTLGTGRRSLSKSDRGVYGVYTGIKTEYDSDHDLHTLQSIGEGQIKANNQNGNIAIGDYLTLSDTPGEAMRQDDDIKRSGTLARAVEPVIFSDPESKLVSVIYEIG